MRLQTTSINYFSSAFPHYYLYDYLPLSAGKDMISRSLLKFKHRTQPDFSTWIECALEALPGISLTPDTIILRALHHDEMTVSIFPTALDFLGHALAGRFNCRYCPSFLRKSRPARPCKELSRRQRKTELRGIYLLDPTARQMITAPAIPPHVAPASDIGRSLERPLPSAPAPPLAAPSAVPHITAAFPPVAVPPLPNPPFLLIDDILTTGTTIRMIIRPLRRTFPLSPIRIFTLARANDDPSAASDHSTIDEPSAAGNPLAANTPSAIANPPAANAPSAIAPAADNPTTRTLTPLTTNPPPQDTPPGQ